MGMDCEEALLLNTILRWKFDRCFLESTSMEYPHDELHKFVALWMDGLKFSNVELGNMNEMIWS